MSDPDEHPAELFRALAYLCEPPAAATAELADLLGLGAPPSAAEFTDLFEFQLYPYASVYLDPSGKLGGEARDRVAGFWRAMGEAPPDEPDHLSTLLAAYAELIERAAASDTDAEASRADPWQRARAAFLWEHLLSWLPVYAAKLGKVAGGLGSSFYADWAGLLDRALIEEVATVGTLGRLPLHLRETATMADPREQGGEEFLQSLLSPARSGIILVSYDLRRAARDTGLGLRKGERLYVLRALLGQAPDPVLSWLAGEARRWESLHSERRGFLGAVAVHWADRAAATRRLLSKLTP